MRGDRKSQPNIHAAGIVLHRCIDELLDFSESYDFIKLTNDFCPSHPQNGAIQVDVFPACQLGMKPGPYFQQGAHPAVNFCEAGSWFCNARKDLEQRAFSRPITADNADHFALLDIERDVSKSPKDIITLV